jgi:hypothetical protein
MITTGLLSSLDSTNLRMPTPNPTVRMAVVVCRISSINLLGDPGEKSSLIVSEIWLYPGRNAPPRIVMRTKRTGEIIPHK